MFRIFLTAKRRASSGEYTIRMSAPRAFNSSGVPFEPGTRIISPKQVKITFGCCDDGQAVIDPAGGQNADGTPGTVHEFDILRQQVAQTMTVDRVRVPTAHFHQPVVPRGIDATGDLVRDVRYEFGVSEFVDVVHPRPCLFVRERIAAHFLDRELVFAHGPQHAQLVLRLFLPDLTQRKADVDEDPVTRVDLRVLEQPDVHVAPHTGHVDPRQQRLLGGDFDDLTGYREAHRSVLLR